MTKILVSGTVSLDLVANSATARTATAAVGNTGANIAVRLAQQGFEVQFVCLIGDDAPGALVISDLERWSVGTSGVVVRPGYSTPLVFQVATGDGSGSDSLSSTCPQCSRPRGHLLQMPEISEIPAQVWGFAEQAEAAVTDTAGETATKLLATTKGLTWYEASLRETTTAQMLQTGAQAQVVKVSSEDLDFYEPLIAQSGKRSQLRVITKGSAGVDWQLDNSHPPTNEWQNWPSSLQQPPVDTIGAGDAFTAGTVMSLARDEFSLSPATVRAAVRAGSDMAAQACMQRGARGDMLVSRGNSKNIGPWVAEEAEFRCSYCSPVPTGA